MLLELVAQHGIEQSEHKQLEEVIEQSDILYVTRIQRERFDDVAQYQALRGSYVINARSLHAAKANMRILHPLPRVDEIATEVDQDPRAAYFRQMENGMYTRMALMALVLGG